ncbi:hypothetical protein NVI2019_NGLDDFDA_03960 (plasmid) [Providencia alcalifaciens]|nr:hypothetical protein NVI2019_NGLDDFDA_03960 [Providencia alcalifaciens]
MFFLTRKREVENYLCPDLIKDDTGVQVDFSGNVMQKIIGKATNTKSNDVLDRF